MSTADPMLRWRGEFPILEHTTYLISNSLGAMPRGVSSAMERYAEVWATRGVRAWEEVWWELPIHVANQIAALLGAPAGSVSLHQNVTTTQAVIASCFDFSGPRNKVVITDLEFPSIQYFYHAQQKYSARVETVPSDDGIRLPLEKFLAAIDEQTLLVPISYVLFRSAARVDARAIVERARHVGAHVILDTFQAAGTVPFNVRELGVDFAVGGVLKWLCGGPGVAYLYAREDLQSRLSPALTGWFSHCRPFNFEPGEIDRRADAYRFLNGTTHIPALYACQPGLEIIEQVGVAAIREKSIHQTEKLIRGAIQRGWQVNTPQNADERGGTVSIHCPHAAEVTRELLAREILVDYRPAAGIRLSPHFYTRDEEVDFALAQIADILDSGAWQRHSAAAHAK